MAVDPTEPFSREEQYLAAIAGEGTKVPPCPWNRKEAYLDKINQEIEDLKNNPDVVDIVDTYADLQAYDKTKLTDNDIIRVLNDETHNGESTYYRYSAATQTFTYIGSTGPKGGEQSDWAENDSADPAYIKNRTHYADTTESTVSQYGSASAGSTPDSGYVWFIEKVEDYALSDILNVEDGDTVYMDITYSVNGATRTDGAKFEVSVENNTVSLDSLAEAGNRWRGAYASELDGDTTFRWPVAAADSSATVYITKLSYEMIKELDAKYIPIDGDTITVDANGKIASTGGGGPTVVQTTGTSTTDVMSQNAVTSMIYADPANARNLKLSGATQASSTTTGAIAAGYSTSVTGNGSIGVSTRRDSNYGLPLQISGANICALTNANGETYSGADGIFIMGSGHGGSNNTVSVGKVIRLGKKTSSTTAGESSTAIGYESAATAQYSLAIGSGGSGANVGASSTAYGACAFGFRSSASGGHSIALGSYSSATQKGQVDIGVGTTTNGYNNSNYRLLTGLYDPQSAHDAATKGYVDANAGGSTMIYASFDPVSLTAGTTVQQDYYKDAQRTVLLTGVELANILLTGSAILNIAYGDLSFIGSLTSTWYNDDIAYITGVFRIDQDIYGNAYDISVNFASDSTSSGGIPTTKVDRLGGLKLVQLTQAAYDALATKDPNTLYVIKAA